MLSSTKDYSIFKLRNENRDNTDKTHLRRMIESMRIKNLTKIRPVIVNDKMEVIDGQYRLWACEVLGYEVFYQKEKEIESSDMLLLSRAQKAWKVQDFIHYYATTGVEAYVNMQRIKDKHGITYQDILNLCGIGGASCYFIKNGRMQFDYDEKETEINELLNIIKTVKEMIKSKSTKDSRFTNTTSFQKALASLASKKNFDPTMCIHKFSIGIGKIDKRSTVDQYYDMMRDVYNCNNKKPITQKRGERTVREQS